MLKIVTMRCTYTVADVAANVLQISAWDSEKRHSLSEISSTPLLELPKITLLFLFQLMDYLLRDSDILRRNFGK